MTLLSLATTTWDQAEYDAIQRVVDSRHFTMGPEVSVFEQQFANHFGCKHAVMVNSGSSANLVMISALKYHSAGFFSPDSEIIVPAVSWSTTYFPVHQCGLSLRFVDVDEGTLNLSVAAVEAALTARTKAVLAVNLLGNPAPLPELKALCDKHGLLLIEDNCESMGAAIGGKATGTWGICGSFSTFFSHHISTMEGGVVVTDDDELYHIMLSLRAHGWLRGQPSGSAIDVELDDFMKLFRFVLPGYNLRPLEMSGAIGQEQLRKLPALVEARRANAVVFRDLFDGASNWSIQQELGQSSWFGFSLVLRDRLAGKRARLVDEFRKAGIESRPIVAGNFVNNPVMRLLNHTISGSLDGADQIDQNGLFIGNHHYPVNDALQYCRELLDCVEAAG